MRPLNIAGIVTGLKSNISENMPNALFIRSIADRERRPINFIYTHMHDNNKEKRDGPEGPGSLREPRDRCLRYIEINDDLNVTEGNGEPYPESPALVPYIHHLLRHGSGSADALEITADPDFPCYRLLCDRLNRYLAPSDEKTPNPFSFTFSEAIA